MGPTELAFTFNNHVLRAERHPTTGEPMFCLKDLCDMLGLEVLDVHDQIRKRCSEADMTRIHARNSRGQNRPMTFVTEAGFWCVVMRSDKEQALAIQRWVTGEVLPAIRKTDLVNWLYQTLLDSAKPLASPQQFYGLAVHVAHLKGQDVALPRSPELEFWSATDIARCYSRLTGTQVGHYVTRALEIDQGLPAGSLVGNADAKTAAWSVWVERGWAERKHETIKITGHTVTVYSYSKPAVLRIVALINEEAYPPTMPLPWRDWSE